METHSQELQAQQYGKAGLFLQAALLGEIFNERTSFHSSPGWQQHALCVHLQEHTCKQALLLLHVVYDCLLTAAASGMNEQTHPNSS